MVELAPKCRRPWLAGLSSLVFPGLGQLYNTQYRRAAYMFAAALTIHVLFTAVWCFTPPATVTWVAFGFCLAFGMLGLRLAAMFDAIRQARRLGAVPLGDLNRRSIYAIFMLFSWIIGLSVEEFRRDHQIWSLHSITGGSMAPAVLPGDQVVAWTGYYRDHRPQPGDVVLFRTTGTPPADFISRLIGLPGDRIQVKDSVVYVNDRPLELVRIEDYPEPRSDPIAQYVEALPNGVRHRILDGRTRDVLRNTVVYPVPAGHYFVLGDNRENALDSRFLNGPVAYVPEENLRARLMFIWWSRSFGRIGTSVQTAP